MNLKLVVVVKNVVDLQYRPTVLSVGLGGVKPPPKKKAPPDISTYTIL
jgi:hypothetical protein